jgi:gamma-glutamyltranspeptidase/glutathione hydrolase
MIGRRTGTRLWRVLVVASAALALVTGAPSRAASVAPATGANGMVVTAQHLATEVGVEVLRRGGNAVDAGVAVGYALAVVYPAAGNLGGGGFMTVQMADGRKAFIDFREQAPLAATKDMFLGADGQVVPRASTRGHLAVAVPGTVAGLELARSRLGSLPRAALLAPAIRLAEGGFVLDQGDVEMLALATADFRADPALGAVFLDRDSRPRQVGDTLVQADLAATLRRIAENGNAGFYGGPVAARLVAANRAGGGVLSVQDLDRYQARERQPVECDYRQYHIVSAPPPSSGGIVVCEVLQILEGYPLSEWGFRSARAVHVQIEALRLAFRDRYRHLGDPDFVDNPVARLIDRGYAEQLRRAIDPARAGGADRAGPGAATSEGSNTTHYSVIDAQGNAVAVTYTLNGWFGAGVMAGGTGVILNNEMDDFSIKPGEPNLYGLVQGAANAIAPGKRPLSSMSPTVVSRDGRVVAVLGSPGGSRIPTAVIHTLINLIDYRMNVQEAVDAPRFHQQWLPKATFVERFALSPDTQALLVAMGHEFSLAQPFSHVAAILVGAPALDGIPVAGQRYYGANDPRRHSGLALGY